MTMFSLLLCLSLEEGTRCLACADLVGAMKLLSAGFGLDVPVRGFNGVFVDGWVFGLGLEEGGGLLVSVRTGILSRLSNQELTGFLNKSGSSSWKDGCLHSWPTAL